MTASPYGDITRWLIAAGHISLQPICLTRRRPPRRALGCGGCELNCEEQKKTKRHIWAEDGGSRVNVETSSGETFKDGLTAGAQQSLKRE